MQQHPTECTYRLCSHKWINSSFCYLHIRRSKSSGLKRLCVISNSFVPQGKMCPVKNKIGQEDVMIILPGVPNDKILKQGAQSNGWVCVYVCVCRWCWTRKRSESTKTTAGSTCMIAACPPTSFQDNTARGRRMRVQSILSLSHSQSIHSPPSHPPILFLSLSISLVIKILITFSFRSSDFNTYYHGPVKYCSLHPKIWAHYYFT